MKRILITGANGQLGRALAATFSRRDDCSVTLTGRRPDAEAGIEALDVTDPGATERAVARGYDFVVNCAAYTAVDAAERDPEGAAALNVAAVENLCRAISRYNEGHCAGRGKEGKDGGNATHGEGHARLVHVSTDYVFSGSGNRPYEPDDEPDPQTVYGRTKLAGEQAALSLLPAESVIIRTAWLYSPVGKNFVRTMVRLGRERSEIKVVNDQTGSPTSAASLADAIVKVIFAPRFEAGIFHYTDRGAATWYEFAATIQRLAGNSCRVIPCRTDEYPTAARRPAYSVLSGEKIRRVYGAEAPDWHEPLRECMAQILKNQ